VTDDVLSRLTAALADRSWQPNERRCSSGSCQTMRSPASAVETDITHKPRYALLKLRQT
jgi:hypothetical protein